MASTQILQCPRRLFGLVDLNALQLYPRPDYWGGHHVRPRILFPPLQPESARSSRTCPRPSPAASALHVLEPVARPTQQVLLPTGIFWDHQVCKA
jgi:hypothetical protein